MWRPSTTVKSGVMWHNILTLGSIEALSEWMNRFPGAKFIWLKAVAR